MQAWGGSSGVTVSGGGDTKTMGYITRNSLGVANIQGWLDIDAFYGSSDSDDNPYLDDHDDNPYRDGPS
jgi:hypothetical protein